MKKANDQMIEKSSAQGGEGSGSASPETSELKKKERIGEGYILFASILYGLSPVLINYGVQKMPPILYAGITSLIGSICIFFYLLAKKEIKQCLDKKVIKASFGIALFIVIIPSISIFIGSQKTSAINTALLPNAELIFTFIACTWIFKEKTNTAKTIGTIIMLISTIVIAYRADFQFNLGDILIISGTIVYPFGNEIGKKILTKTSPSIIVFERSLIGGIVLIAISAIFENWNNESIKSISEYSHIILLNAALIVWLEKIIWYKGLRLLDMGKAIPLMIGGASAFGILFSYVFLKEIPTPQQIIGFFLIVIGLFVLSKSKSEVAHDV